MRIGRKIVFWQNLCLEKKTYFTEFIFENFPENLSFSQKIDPFCKFWNKKERIRRIYFHELYSKINLTRIYFRIDIDEIIPAFCFTKLKLLLEI